MDKKILELVLYTVPLAYGSYMFLKAQYEISHSPQIDDDSDEEAISRNKTLKKMKRKGQIFFLLSVYFFYQFYKRYFG